MGYNIAERVANEIRTAKMRKGAAAVANNPSNPNSPWAQSVARQNRDGSIDGYQGPNFNVPAPPLQDDVGAALRFLAETMGSGGGGGGGTQTKTTTTSRNRGPFVYTGPGDEDVNAYLSRILGGINQAYDHAQGVLGEQRGRAAGEIDSAHRMASEELGRSQRDFTQQMMGYNQQIGQAAQQERLRALGDSVAVARDLQGQGNGSTVARDMAVGAANNIGEQQMLQAALAQRLNQVQQAQHVDTNNSSSMVQQGAQGTLANNYSDILGRIQAERAKETAAATGDAEKMRMQFAMEKARAYQDYLNGSGSETSTTTVSGGDSGAAPEDPLDRMLKMQKVLAGQRELAGGAGGPDVGGMSEYAQRFILSGDPMTSLATYAQQQQKNPGQDPEWPRVQQQVEAEIVNFLRKQYAAGNYNPLK